MSARADNPQQIADEFIANRRSGSRMSVEVFLRDKAAGDPDAAAVIERIAEHVRTHGPPSIPALAEASDLVDAAELEGYDVVDVLGMGAMGIVYEAYQRSTGRRVAVKHMHEHASRRESARRRFEREVELVARLQHPGIVPIIDSGVSKGDYFYAMEFVEGKTLDQVRPPGSWGTAEALKVIASVARSVDYAHQRGVLHRDLKPQNIIIDEQGHPKLLDFGLAKAFDPLHQVHQNMSLSSPGQLVGTVAYMSPEQARGDIDALSTRSDIYALGTIAYEMIAGELPVDVDAPLHVALARIERDDPRPLSALRSGVSRDVDAVLLMALEKDPAKRYGSAAEFARDLEGALSDRRVRARTPTRFERVARWSRRHKVATAVIAGAVVVTLIFGVLLESGRRERRSAALTHLQLIIDAVDGASRGEAADSGRALARLDGYVREIDTKLAGNPEFQALARQRAGQAYLEWKSYARASEQLVEALRLQSALLGEDHAAVGDTLHLLGRTQFWLGLYAEAMTFYERALAIRSAAHGPDDSRVLNTRLHIVSTSQRLGRLRDAEREYSAIERTLESAQAPDAIALSRTRLNHASCLQEMGRYPAAIALITRARSDLAVEPNPDDTHLARATHSLGACYLRVGRAEDARTHLTEALRVKEQQYRSDDASGTMNDDIANTLLELGELAMHDGRTDDALGLTTRALDAFRAKFPDGHRKVGIALLTKGWVHAARGEWDDAGGMHTLARNHLASVLTPDNQLTAEAACGVALARWNAVADRAVVDRSEITDFGRYLTMTERDRESEHWGVRRVRRYAHDAAGLESLADHRDHLLGLLEPL